MLQQKTPFIYFSFTYILFIQSIGRIASEVYVVSLPDISDSMNSTSNIIQLSVSAFMLGYGFLQILYGPLSDAFGRKYPLLLGMILLLFGTYFSMQAQNPVELLIGRLLQGLGAESSNVIFKTIIRDV